MEPKNSTPWVVQGSYLKKMTILRDLLYRETRLDGDTQRDWADIIRLMLEESGPLGDLEETGKNE